MISKLGEDSVILMEVGTDARPQQGATLSGLLTPSTSHRFAIYRIENRYDLKFYEERPHPRIVKVHPEQLAGQGWSTSSFVAGRLRDGYLGFGGRPGTRRL